MAYDLEAIKQKLADLSGGRNSGKDRVKLTWFKPVLTSDGGKSSYEIRFLPYVDRNGQPFEEVSYYDNKSLSETRFVVPSQYQMEDPVFDLINELKKENTRETWRLMNNLRPRDRFYAPILVRGEEEKGIQIWELSPNILKDIYGILAHPDYAEENMMEVNDGFDFTLTVTDSGKKFNTWTIKNYDLQPRRKASKVAKTKKEIDELIASMPDLGAYFKAQVKNAEWIKQAVENFLAKTAGDDGEETSTNVGKEVNSAGKNHTSSKGLSAKDDAAAATKNIEDAFSDLDDDVSELF